MGKIGRGNTAGQCRMAPQVNRIQSGLQREHQVEQHQRIHHRLRIEQRRNRQAWCIWYIKRHPHPLAHLVKHQKWPDQCGDQHPEHQTLHIGIDARQAEYQILKHRIARNKQSQKNCARRHGQPPRPQCPTHILRPQHNLPAGSCIA